MIFLPLAQGSSSSASGTRVVLPAPGGATSTAELLFTSVRASSSSTASIGRGVSKERGKISPHRRARACPAHPPLCYARQQDVAGPDKPAHQRKFPGPQREKRHSFRASRARPT